MRKSLQWKSRKLNLLTWNDEKNSKKKLNGTIKKIINYILLICWRHVFIVWYAWHWSKFRFQTLLLSCVHLRQFRLREFTCGPPQNTTTNFGFPMWGLTSALWRASSRYNWTSFDQHADDDRLLLHNHSHTDDMLLFLGKVLQSY